MQNSLDDERNALGTEPIPGLMLKYTVPSIVSMVVMALYNIVDQIFIGHGVGYLGNTATTVTLPLITVGLALALLAGNGSSALISLNLGRGMADTVKSILGSALAALSFLGVTLAVLAALFLRPLLTAFGATAPVMPYAVDYGGIILIGLPFSMLATAMSHAIRTDGSPRYSMMCTLSGAFLNTILDPIFIFTFKMGVRGAAIATVIAQIVSFCIGAYYLLRMAKYLRLSPKALKPVFSLIRQTAAYGSSGFMNQIAMFCVTLVVNRSLVHYGSLSAYGSEIPLAALGIVMKINMILISIIIGISIGMQPILGFNYGAKNNVRVKQALRIGVTAAGILAAAVNVLFIAIPGVFISVFGDANPQFNSFAELALSTYMCCVVAAGVQIPCSLYFMATGRPIKAMTLQLTRSMFLLIPLTLILPVFFGLNGILYAAPASDIIALIVTSSFVINEMRHMGRNEIADGSPVSAEPPIL